MVQNSEKLSTKNESHIEKENDETNPHEVPSYLTLLKYTEGYGAGLSIEKAKYDIVKDIFKTFASVFIILVFTHRSIIPQHAKSTFLILLSVIQL